MATSILLTNLYILVDNNMHLQTCCNVRTEVPVAVIEPPIKEDENEIIRFK